MAEVQSPNLKDAPKVQPDLKSQLEQFDPKELNNVEPQEKSVLPTAEGKSFHHQTTQMSLKSFGNTNCYINYLSMLLVIALVSMIGNDYERQHMIDINETKVFKTGDCWLLLDVKEEKQHIAFVESVNCFKTEQLRKTETVEKVVLPNAEGKQWNE